MTWKVISLVLRIVIAVVIGVFLIEWAGATPLLAIVGVVYGVILWALFGIPWIRRVGDKFASLYVGNDADIRIVPEYSVAEARAQVGKYQEAVDEYRKVIVEHPDDIYPHLRIAELAVNHLNDVKLAELELLSAIAKAQGNDSTTLAAGRLADFYQVTLHDPARALAVMKQLREKIPGTKQARLAEERITTLEKIVAGTAPLPSAPDKIAPRPSRYKMPE
jgi:hypothetical protein